MVDYTSNVLTFPQSVSTRLQEREKLHVTLQEMKRQLEGLRVIIKGHQDIIHAQHVVLAHYIKQERDMSQLINDVLKEIGGL